VLRTRSRGLRNVLHCSLLNWLIVSSVCIFLCLSVCAHTHTHQFNGPLSRTTRVSRYEKGKTNLDFTEARDSEWQWHQLGHMQVCTSLQTDNPSPLSFLQAGCPSCRPTNSDKTLKAPVRVLIFCLSAIHFLKANSHRHARHAVETRHDTVEMC